MAETRPYPSFRLYRDKAGEWRWNYAARNGNIIAASSEGYGRKDDAMRGIELITGASGHTVWEDPGAIA